MECRPALSDQEAYEELVRRYQDVAVRTAHIVSPDGDAEDAVQDAFVKAYAALSRFRIEAPFRPWLLRIVANEARNRRRSAGRRVHLALRAHQARGEALRLVSLTAAERAENRSVLRADLGDRPACGARPRALLAIVGGMTALPRARRNTIEYALTTASSTNSAGSRRRARRR